MLFAGLDFGGKYGGIFTEVSKRRQKAEGRFWGQCKYNPYRATKPANNTFLFFTGRYARRSCFLIGYHTGQYEPIRTSLGSYGPVQGDLSQNIICRFCRSV